MITFPFTMHAPTAVAVEFITTSENGGTGSTVNCSVPGGVQDGDILIGVYGGARGDNVFLSSGPSGFTEDEVIEDGSGNSAWTIWFGHKVASSESGNWTFTAVGSGEPKAAVVLVYRPGSATQLANTTTQTTGTDVTSHTTPTSGGGGSDLNMRVSAWGLFRGPNSEVVISTDPSNMTQRSFQKLNNSGPSATGRYGVVVYDGLIGDAGTGAVTAITTNAMEDGSIQGVITAA